MGYVLNCIIFTEIVKEIASKPSPLQQKRSSSGLGYDALSHETTRVKNIPEGLVCVSKLMIEGDFYIYKTIPNYAEP